MQSYALDAIDAGGEGSEVEKQSAKKLIEDALNAAVKQFPAVGEGDDLRLRGKRLSGCALVVDERIVHLSFSAYGKIAAQALKRGREASLAHPCGVAVRLSNDDRCRAEKNWWN